MTSARAPRNTSAQPDDRYGVTSTCLGNDHDISVAGSWRDVTLPLRKTKQTNPLQTCYEHNMLPLLHAVCLKVLDFFFAFLLPAQTGPSSMPVPCAAVRNSDIVCREFMLVTLQSWLITYIPRSHCEFFVLWGHPPHK